MKKIIFTLLSILAILLSISCKKKSLINSIANTQEKKEFSGTYCAYNESEDTAQIIIFYDNNEFVLMDISDNIVLSKRFALRKDNDTYYVKLIATYNFGWEEETSQEEIIDMQDMEDILIIEGKTYTNWESLYGDIAESFEQSMESYFEGIWTDFSTSKYTKNDVITFNGNRYATDSGFEGSFYFKNSSLNFMGYEPTSTYILDKDHFASIPDTDGETICNIYERIEVEN